MHQAPCASSFCCRVCRVHPQSCHCSGLSCVALPKPGCWGPKMGPAPCPCLPSLRMTLSRWKIVSRPLRSSVHCPHQKLLPSALLLDSVSACRWPSGLPEQLELPWPCGLECAPPLCLRCIACCPHPHPGCDNRIRNLLSLRPRCATVPP